MEHTMEKWEMYIIIVSKETKTQILKIGLNAKKALTHMLLNEQIQQELPIIEYL